MDLLRSIRSLPRFDIGLAVVLTVLNAADSVASEDSWSVPVWVIGIAGCLALAWRRRAPAAVLLGTTVADALASVLFPADGPISVAVLVALYTVASQWGLTARSAVLLTGCTAAEALLASGPISAGLTTTALVVMLVIILVGLWIGARRAKITQLKERVEAAERERGLRAATAVAEERLRIAREVHDLLAHSLSVIVIQAAAGADAFSRRPERSHQALTTIETVGRDSLRELRSLVGALSQDPSSDGTEALAGQATLDALPALVETVRSTGLEVRLQMPSDLTGIPAAMGMSAYRIVQEALTNTMRHARARTATVTLTHSPDALGIEVVDDGRQPPVSSPGSGRTGDPADPPDLRSAVGAGRGLLGMRERAAAFGGTISAHPRPGGGFAVEARLPLTREAP